MSVSKNIRSEVFNTQADAYDRYRPGYPKAIVDEIKQVIGPQADCLEIGSGTGQLTADLLSSGYRITCVEKGTALCEKLREKFRGNKTLTVFNEAFENWQSDRKFRAVLSAQAFHWIEMESGIDKVSNLLEPGGYFLLIWTIDRSQDTDLWKKTDHLYDQYLPASSQGKSTPEVIDGHKEYLQERGDFQQTHTTTACWGKVFSKADYLGLLSTFSPHMSLPEPARSEFFQKIAAAIDDTGGSVQRLYETVMISAKYTDW